MIGSRRLLTYRRLPSVEVDEAMLRNKEDEQAKRVTANDLNSFRKRVYKPFSPSIRQSAKTQAQYFQGFKAAIEKGDAAGTEKTDHR